MTICEVPGHTLIVGENQTDVLNCISDIVSCISENRLWSNKSDQNEI